MPKYEVKWTESCRSYVEADSAQQACEKAKQATLGHDDEGVYANRICGEDSDNFSAVLYDPVEQDIARKVEMLMSNIKWEHNERTPDWEGIKAQLFYAIREGVRTGRLLGCEDGDVFLIGSEEEPKVWEQYIEGETTMDRTTDDTGLTPVGLELTEFIKEMAMVLNKANAEMLRAERAEEKADDKQ